MGSTGTWERAWRRESSPRPGRILLLSRRIMRRSDWTPWRLMTRMAKSTEQRTLDQIYLNENSIYLKWFYKYYNFTHFKIEKNKHSFRKKKKKKKKTFFQKKKKKKKKKK